eukprot:358750-Chlamydomonas_euryale.AAC.3
MFSLIKPVRLLEIVYPEPELPTTGMLSLERSKAEGIKQRAGRCHKGNAIAHGPEPRHTNPAPPTGT